MIELGLIAVAVGLDNLRAGVAIGWAGTSTAQRLRYALAFGVTESTMPLVGLALGTAATGISGFCQWIGPLALTACGLLCLVPRPDQDRASKRRHLLDARWALVALPISLGLDNLLAGVALATLDVPVLLAAAVVGVVSTILATIGLYLGNAMHLRAPTRLLAALILLAVAGLEAFDVL
jgi:putative Mn2+ efflux pump MntP